MAGYAGAVGMGSGTLIDIGGGSTEVITGNAEGITFAKSLEVGVVRLLDRLGQYDKAKKDEYFAYINGVLQQLQGLEQTPNLIGVSGTATTAVAIKLGLETYSPEKVQGTVLTAKEIEEMLDMLASLSLEERKQVTGLSPQRADVICHGLSVLYCFMIGYGFDEITVSDRDNLEGYLTLRLNGYFGA
jgi:exopolyphosphatase/guanosine-5'-triphosphate,3'-diphosphate pyrophosphatase